MYLFLQDIVFNSNPFFQRSNYIETPFSYVENWVSNEFCFKSFKSGNPYDRWIYFIIHKGLIVQATPEFLEDTDLARLEFSKLFNININNEPI